MQSVRFPPQSKFVLSMQQTHSICHKYFIRRVEMELKSKTQRGGAGGYV